MTTMRPPLDPSFEHHGLDWPAVTRYLAGTPSPDDTTRIRAWLGDDLERRRELEFLRTIWLESQELSGIRPALSPDSMAERLTAGLPVKTGARRSSSRRWAPRGLIATTGALLLIVATWGWRSISQLAEAEETREYVTARGQRASLELPDGSRVTLGPATTLHYEATSSGPRMLQLSGQAYFDILGAATRPFIVSTGTSTTRVLGTSFLVRAYAEDTTTAVAVTSGRILFDGSDSSVVLGAGEAAAAGIRGIPSRLDAIIMRRLLEWMQGTITLDDVPLRDAIPELERAFDVNIRILDPRLAGRRISATLKDASVEVMLSTIIPAIDAVATQQGRTITLRSAGA